MKVNWCGVTVTDDAGKILYHNAFITDWQISPGNVAGLVAAGRARRKIANENNNGPITECLRETACTAARHC